MKERIVCNNCGLIKQELNWFMKITGIAFFSFQTSNGHKYNLCEYCTQLKYKQQKYKGIRK